METKKPGLEKLGTKKTYDVIIVGGSAAGLTAALYAARRELKTLVLTKDIGGQIAITETIKNYPGWEKITGSDLVKILEKQAIESGAEIVIKEVVKIEELKDSGRELFIVKTHSEDEHTKNGTKLKGEEYAGRTVILASGKTPRSLNVPGESKFVGKGVSYCATCDAPLFRNKIVAVVGGGNSAFEAALLLSSVAKKVYIIHRRDEFRAFEKIINDVKQKKNLEFVLSSAIVEIKGSRFVEAAVLENRKTNKRSELKLDGIFVEIGSDVDTDFVKGLVELDETDQIKTNKNAETSHPGIFAAGDVTDTPFKQIIVAAGEGSKAALAAYNYIHEIENKYVIDWSTHKHEHKADLNKNEKNES